MFTGLGGAAIFFRAPQPCLFVLFITVRNPHGQSPLCTLASDAESEARGSQNLPTMSQKCDLRIRQIICCFFPTLGANTKGLAMEDYHHGQKKIPKPKMGSCWAEPGSTSTPTPAIPRLTLGRQRLPWAWAAIYNSQENSRESSITENHSQGGRGKQIDSGKFLLSQPAMKAGRKVDDGEQTKGFQDLHQSGDLYFIGTQKCRCISACITETMPWTC